MERCGSFGMRLIWMTHKHFLITSIAHINFKSVICVTCANFGSWIFHQHDTLIMAWTWELFIASTLKWHFFQNSPRCCLKLGLLCYLVNFGGYNFYKKINQIEHENILSYIPWRKLFNMILNFLVEHYSIPQMMA